MTFLSPPPGPTTTSSSFIGVRAQKGSACRLVSGISGGVPVSLTDAGDGRVPGGPERRRRGDGARGGSAARARGRRLLGRLALLAGRSWPPARRPCREPRSDVQRSSWASFSSGSVLTAAPSSVKRRSRPGRRPRGVGRAPPGWRGSSRGCGAAGRRAPGSRRGRSRIARPPPARLLGRLASPMPTLNPPTTAASIASAGPGQERPGDGVRAVAGRVRGQAFGGVARGIDGDRHQVEVGAELAGAPADLGHALAQQRAGRLAGGEDEVGHPDPARELAAFRTAGRADR